MNPSLAKLLDYLAKHLSPEHARQSRDRFERSLRFEPVDRLPVICSYPLDPELQWQPFPHSEIFEDPEKMLFNELVYAFDTSIAYQDHVGDDLPYTVRANFGTVIVASLLGGNVEFRGDNPPWVTPFESKDELAAVLDRDPGAWNGGGLAGRVIETYEHYNAMLAEYPELATVVRMVLPDTQSPLDTAEVLRGSELFLDFYMDPEFIEALLTHVAETQMSFLEAVRPHVTDLGDGFSHQHATMIKGNVLLRDDSTVMISPEMYGEYVAPHDQRVLAAMEGGGIHSCGKMDQLTGGYLEIPSLESIDLGQSELNDVDMVYFRAAERQVPLIRVAAGRKELTTGSIMNRFPTGVTLIYRAQSMQDAADVMQAYKRATESE